MIYTMSILWFFIRIAIVVGISFWVSQLQGKAIVYAYGYEIHMRLWFVVGIGIVGVCFVWYLGRIIRGIHTCIVYVTRTRKIYKQVGGVPAVLTHDVATVKNAFGKNHPLTHMGRYMHNPHYDIPIESVLQSEYAGYMIRVFMIRLDMGRLGVVQSYYNRDTTRIPPVEFYIYQATQAKTVSQSMAFLAYIKSSVSKADFAFYMAWVYNRHGEPDVLDKIYDAWRLALTSMQKWRICLECMDISVKNIADMRKFDKKISKKDAYGNIILALLSHNLGVSGAVQNYVHMAQPDVPDVYIKLIQTYLDYDIAKQNQDENLADYACAYIQAVQAQPQSEMEVFLCKHTV